MSERKDKLLLRGILIFAALLLVVTVMYGMCGGA